MPNAIIWTLNAPAPSGFSGSARVDHFSVIEARSSLVFWGDASTVTEASGAVSDWASRANELGAYEQGTGSKQPTLVAASASVLNSNRHLSFSGTADANGDRMEENASMVDFPVSSGFTVVDVLMSDALDGTRYAYGQISGNDAIAAYSSSVGGGSMNLRWGDATASLPIVADEWNVCMTVAKGSVSSDSVQIIMGGASDEATPTVAPTTARAVSLGATSALSDAGLWSGGIAERMIFNEDATSDAAFMSTLGEYFQFKYALSSDPLSVA